MAVADGPIRLALTGVCLDPMTYKTLSHILMGVPGATAVGNFERYVGAEREVGRAVERAQNRICVIDYDQNHDEAIWVTERLHAEAPDIYIFAASAYPEPERIIAAMRAGCAEYLLKPLQNERVLDGVARVEAKQKERVRSKVRGKIVTLLGAKGGTGVTSLALHLALELATGGRKCLLVDQHPSLGDVSLYLGAGRHQYGFYELASNTDRLDEELLQGFLLTHESGLHLLDSPESYEAAHYAPPAAVEQTLTFLAETYAYIVVDCPPGLSDATLACVAQSDQVAVVLTAELPAIRNAVRYNEHLAKIGYNVDNIHLVLNRHSKKGPLTDEKVEKALQRPISLRVPNCYDEVIRAINTGKPITGDKSGYSAAIQKWARDLAKTDQAGKANAAATEGGSRNSLLGIFGR
jgi:pilus assembly protein CpaE